MAQSLLDMKGCLNTSFSKEIVNIAQGFEVYPIPKIITPQGTFLILDFVLNKDNLLILESKENNSAYIQ